MASSCHLHLRTSFSSSTSTILPPTFHHRWLLPSSRASIPSSNQEDGDHGASLFSVQLKSQGNGADTAQEIGLASGSSDVMKLFNDVQQNMLLLNKQRIDAIDNLQKVEQEKEVLLARVGLLQAENEALATERDVLHRELQAFKSIVGSLGMQAGTEGSGKGSPIPSPIFSELVLRIDSMVLTGAINVGQASLLKSLALKQDVQAANVFSSLRNKGDKELASGLFPLLDPNRRFGLHITHVCTELDPVAKFGALADYVLNLSRALQRKGNLVEVILPKYSTMNLDGVQNLTSNQVDFHSFFGGQWHQNKVWTGVVQGIPVTLIDSLHPGGFFLRDRLYNYSDDFERFSYFCRAALEYMLKTGKQPDVLHLHSWQTALAAPMFWELFTSQGLGETRILFTCNNFRDQCLQEPGKLGLCGLDPGRLHRADRLQDNVQPNLVNLLKGGIVFSNKVIMASPFSVPDIISRDHGHGLQPSLAAHRNKIISICNGLDKSVWNPAMDVNLPAVYASEDLSGKLICKVQLRKQLGLPFEDDSIPLIGCLARHISELELELIKTALDCARAKGAHYIFMGESKMTHLQKKILDLQDGLEDECGSVLPKYDDLMAHWIIAASDILICPSMDEAMAEMPLIAMQYGTIPVLKQQEAPNGRAKDLFGGTQPSAYVYRTARAHELRSALMSAIECKITDPDTWKRLVINGMSKDFSWDGECVEQYIDAYMSIKEL